MIVLRKMSEVELDEYWAQLDQWYARVMTAPPVDDRGVVSSPEEEAELLGQAIQDPTEAINRAIKMHQSGEPLADIMKEMIRVAFVRGYISGRIIGKREALEESFGVAV